MGRVFALLVLAAVVGLVAAPFIATSRALDEHGVPLRGSVYEKREWALTRYSTWEVKREVTIQYTVPENGSYAFLRARPTVEAYDALRPQQPVELRYLPKQHVPDVPGARMLWELRVGSAVRVTGFEEVGAFDSLNTPSGRFGLTMAGGAILLILLWKATRARVFAWSAAAAGVVVFVVILMSEFAGRTPAPAVDVRRAGGRVVRIEHIDTILEGSRSRGEIAEQPIDVVCVEFVPAGRTEPVMAVDLIDRGSLPNLKERSTVTLTYEAGWPRTAWIDGASRHFPERNLRSLIVTAVVGLAMVLGVLVAVNWIGRAFQRLIRRST